MRDFFEVINDYKMTTFCIYLMVSGIIYQFKRKD
jgi:hypothetical protein